MSRSRKWVINRHFRPSSSRPRLHLAPPTSPSPFWHLRRNSLQLSDSPRSQHRSTSRLEVHSCSCYCSLSWHATYSRIVLPRAILISSLASCKMSRKRHHLPSIRTLTLAGLTGKTFGVYIPTWMTNASLLSQNRFELNVYHDATQRTFSLAGIRLSRRAHRSINLSFLLTLCTQEFFVHNHSPLEYPHIWDGHIPLALMCDFSNSHSASPDIS